jgi:hypothetical protein
MNIFPTGSKTYFCQTTAPTGWTQVVTSVHDCMIRVIGSAGTGGTVGGSTGFSACFASHTWSGTASYTSAATGPTILDSTQIPAHNHNIVVYPGTSPGSMGNLPPYPIPAITGTSGITSSTVGGGEGGDAHSHSITLTSVSGTNLGSTNFAVQYLDVILCTAS